MGRLLADTIRLSSLDAAWVERHVQIPILSRYVAAHASGKGVLVATGHLGSFELLGHAIGLVGHPLAAIARKFKSPQLDKWWTGLREARGNRIIDRTGAFKAMVSLAVAGAADALEVAFPPAWLVVDAFATVAFFLIWGLRWEIALVLLPELVPGMNVFPSWTLLAMYLKKKDAGNG
jgi:hypothetical protein